MDNVEMVNRLKINIMQLEPGMKLILTGFNAPSYEWEINFLTDNHKRFTFPIEVEVSTDGVNLLVNPPDPNNFKWSIEWFKYTPDNSEI